MQKKSPMHIALHYAEIAKGKGEVPVGAVVLRGDDVIAMQYNQVEALRDPTAHAELLAVREACEKLQTRYLTDCTLYVTLEPCAMCAHALSLARIQSIIFGAYDPKGGGVEHGARVFDHKTCVHKPEVIGGVEAQASAQLLQEFFTSLRA